MNKPFKKKSNYLKMKFESSFCLTNESRAESIFSSKLLKTIFKVYWTCTMYIAQGSRHASELVTTKGQLILKCLFGIFNSPKKRMKKFDFTTMVPQVE